MKYFGKILPLLLLALFALPAKSLAAFGLTTNANNFTVDTGAGLVFKVYTDNPSSTTSPGDIRSMVYNGVEYQDTSRGSQINSGFDNLGYSNSTATVTAEVVNTNYIKITVTTANLVHYYLVRKGYPHIYMATWFNVQPVTGGGLCRYIVRANQTLLPNGPRPSDNSLTTYTVESGDIFGMPDGQTRSKHYSNHRLIDWFATGATGSGVGVFMMRENQEGGSGGPFFRCLINQGGGDQELYDIINYGENQTEAFRGNILNGPYALVFNSGFFPTAPLDYTWLETAGLNLTHFVPASGRGAVTGTATGVPNGFQTVVGFANTNAQYWAIATNGVYTTPLMIPGTYNVTLYKQEYAVATTTTTVSAGVTNTLNLASTENNPAFVFKLGEWDGTPAGFLNSDKMTYMHPSDVRMSAWTNTDFTVENNPTPQFPCIQARQVNGTLTIRFNLTAAQAAAAHTFRIGITTAYNNGRPVVAVNSGYNSGTPGISTQPNSRTFTTGSYRGNNWLYTYSIPASAFVTGQNILTFGPNSGSSDLGGWLSAGYVLDCVQMDGTPIAPLAPANVVASLNPAQVNLSWTPVFNAVSYKIKRATTRGGPYISIATNVVASFNDTNVAAATRYYYVVTSMNSVGESANSMEVAAGIEPALVAYLPFDENSGTNATDVAGNGWNGTLQNSASWNVGKYGSAANLNGTSNYVSLPAGVISGLNDFTIAAWVNQNSVSSWSRIFDFGNGTTSYMFLTPRNGASSTIRFAISVAGGSGEQQINGTSALPTGWHHVAVTLSGSNGVLYVDGVAVGTNNAMTLKPSDLSQPADSNPTLNNYLGKSQFADPYLNGRVDDFRIYNGALSAAQISALVSAPSLVPTNFTATVVSSSQVNLKWNAAPGATDYNVLRSPTSGGPYLTIASGLSVTNYSDTSVSSGATYYYVVAAVDGLGAGINSAEAVAVISTPIWTGGGGDNNWTTGLNWLGGFAPATNGANVVIAGSTRLTPNLDTNFNVAALVFSNNASSFNIGTANASTLTLSGGVTNNSTNAQTLSVPVVLNGAQTLNAAAGNLTFSSSLNKAGNLLTVTGAANTVLSGAISGSGSLFKQGGGVLTIKTNAAWDLTQATSGGFSGPLIAQAGLLVFNNGGSNFVNGELVIGGVVANGGAGNNAAIIVDNAKLNVATWLSVGRGNGIGGVSSDLVLTNGAVVMATNVSMGFNGGSTANLPKGSLTMASNTVFTVNGNGVFYVGESAGSDMTVNVNGNAQWIATGTGAKRIGAGGGGVMNVNDAALVNFAGNGAVSVGYASGSGTLNLNGGTMTISTPSSGAGIGLQIAASTASGNVVTGVVNVASGATLTSAGDCIIGVGGTQSGTLNLNGGVVNIGTTATKWMILGQYDTVSGVVNLNSGLLNLNAGTSIKFTTGSTGTAGTNVFNQNGGNVTFYSDNGVTVGGAGDLNLQQSGSASVNNTYNLNGGTLTVPQIGSTLATGTRVFNFNGGTLKAAKANTTFMSLGAGNAVANVRNGGAVIDTAGFNVTIGQPLQHSVLGGDNAVDGGLTKKGAGTLILSGANTYNGNTTVSGGTLELALATLATNSVVTITNGAKLQLDFAVTNLVGALVLNGIMQPGGIYSSSTTPSFLVGAGKLQVVSSIATNPTNISFAVSGNMLTLSWPADHTGWRLQAQTNSLAAGLATNWIEVAGSIATNVVTLPVDLKQGSVFYRLIYP